MSLSDIACRTLLKNAKQLGRSIKKADGKGLYLCAQPSGVGYWRYKYRLFGKEKLLAIGIYPDISLAEARELHLVAYRQVRDKKDPTKEKRDAARVASLNAENTFEVIAREWHTHNLKKWDPRYAQTVLNRMETDLLPPLGKIPIREITPLNILDAIRKIEEREAYDIARRALQTVSQVFRYAVVSSRADRDISVDLKGALKPYKKGNFASMEQSELPNFLKKLDRNDARLFPETRYLVELMMLTFVRTTELIQAEWKEFDLDKEKRWFIPGPRMKMENDHIVPLSTQSIRILGDLKKLNPFSEYVFPSKKRNKKYMSNGTILGALQRMGYQGEHTGHGFRALAMSTLKEQLYYRHEVVDRQLAHVPKDEVDKAYDRAKYLKQRTKMMQDWANYIDKLRSSEK